MAFVQEVKKNVDAVTLNGASNASFLGAGSKAADASLLNGSSAYLTTTGKAADSSLLNGSSAYLASNGKAADSSLLNGASNYSLDNHNHDGTYTKLCTTGTEAPSSTPASVGLIYINTSTKDVYMSAGTGASGDWIKLN